MTIIDWKIPGPALHEVNSQYMDYDSSFGIRSANTERLQCINTELRIIDGLRRS